MTSPAAELWRSLDEPFDPHAVRTGSPLRVANALLRRFGSMPSWADMLAMNVEPRLAEGPAPLDLDAPVDEWTEVDWARRDAWLRYRHRPGLASIPFLHRHHPEQIRTAVLAWFTEARARV